MVDNNKFWKTVRPFFSDTLSRKETINLVEKDVVVKKKKDFQAIVFILR